MARVNKAAGEGLDFAALLALRRRKRAEAEKQAGADTKSQAHASLMRNPDAAIHLQDLTTNKKTPARDTKDQKPDQTAKHRKTLRDTQPADPTTARKQRALKPLTDDLKNKPLPPIVKDEDRELSRAERKKGVARPIPKSHVKARAEKDDEDTPVLYPDEDDSLAIIRYWAKPPSPQQRATVVQPKLKPEDTAVPPPVFVEQVKSSINPGKKPLPDPSKAPPFKKAAKTRPKPRGKTNNGSGANWTADPGDDPFKPPFDFSDAPPLKSTSRAKRQFYGLEERSTKISMDSWVTVAGDAESLPALPPCQIDVLASSAATFQFADDEPLIESQASLNDGWADNGFFFNAGQTMEVSDEEDPWLDSDSKGRSDMSSGVNTSNKPSPRDEIMLDTGRQMAQAYQLGHGEGHMLSNQNRFSDEQRGMAKDVGNKASNLGRVTDLQMGSTPIDRAATSPALLGSGATKMPDLLSESAAKKKINALYGDGSSQSTVKYEFSKEEPPILLSDRYKKKTANMFDMSSSRSSLYCEYSDLEGPQTAKKVSVEMKSSFAHGQYEYSDDEDVELPETPTKAPRSKDTIKENDRAPRVSRKTKTHLASHYEKLRNDSSPWGDGEHAKPSTLRTVSYAESYESEVITPSAGNVLEQLIDRDTKEIERKEEESRQAARQSWEQEHAAFLTYDPRVSPIRLDPRTSSSRLTPHASSIQLDPHASSIQLDPHESPIRFERPQAPTPCGSPSKGKLKSPTKETPPRQQIPDLTSDEYWQQLQEITFEKTPKIKSIMDDDAINSPRRGLIRRTWDGCKNDIAVAFLYEIDEAMTGGEVGRATEDTGGVRIVWTNKLSTTAGRASWRVERVVINGQREERKHWATIELAEKVVDSEERLINVIAHEYCHLATYIVSGVRDRPHGKEFREWGKQATKLYHDRGVVVTTKHTYDIKYKYIWRCTGCTLHIQRHSKSIKPATQLCGICQGRLEQIKPAPRVRAGEDVDMGPPPQLNAYASFVKENYQLARELSPQGALPKTIMGNLARMYRDQKEMRAKMFTEHDAAKMADAMANRAGMESDGEDGKENKRAENEGDDGGYENEVEVEGAECITDAMGRVDLTE